MQGPISKEHILEQCIEQTCSIGVRSFKQHGVVMFKKKFKAVVQG